MTVNPRFSQCAALLLKAALALSPAVVFPVNAAVQTYKVSFAATSGDSGQGSFVWDDVSLLMTSFNWSFPAGNGTFSDSALAKTIYSPGSARSTGALLFNLFTDPQTYWLSTNGLLSASSGYFTKTFIGSSGALSGTYPPDMLAISYTKGAAAATYEFLRLGPRTVLASGTISAAPVPEPGSVAMLLAGLGLTGVMVRRRTRGAA